MSGRTAARSLPDRPSLEHLKNQARRRLRDLKAGGAAAKLADAQLGIARDYGFSSWRELKSFVEGQALPAGRFANLVGFYRHDPQIVRNGLLSVIAAGGRLYVEFTPGARLELLDAGDGRFRIAGLGEQFSFEGAEDGPAKAFVNHLRSGEARLERIGSAEAQAMMDAREQALADQARPRLEVAVAPETLERYAGHYASPFGPALTVEHRDGRLWVEVVGQPQIEVFPESETKAFYRLLPAQISFVAQGARVTAAILHQGGTDQRMDRVPAEMAERSTAAIRERVAEQERPRAVASIDPSLLARYAGRYRFGPDRAIEVTAEDGRLFVQATGQARCEVYPESEAAFFWTVVAAQISFVPDASGRIAHAVLHQAGRDMPLPRVDVEGAAA